MPTLCHASPTRNRQAIATQGLLPYWQWVHRAGSKSYEHEPVHLADNADPAWLADLHDVDAMDTWMVDVSGLEDDLRLGQDGLGTWDIYRWIEPWRLTRVS